MDEARKRKLKDIVCGMDSEELSVLVTHIPSNYLWDELRRRDEKMTKTILNMCTVITKEE